MNFDKQFLVALPKLVDSAFGKSVIFVDKHDGDGAHGWIVNKQVDKSTAARLRRGMGLSKEVPVFWGGPLDINSAVILHSSDFSIRSTVKLNDTLSMTRDKTIINIINMGQFPEYWRIIVGHSGWAAGQLESEVLGSRTNGIAHWTGIPYSHNLMWNTMPDAQWETGLNMYAEQMTNNLLKIQEVE